LSDPRQDHRQRLTLRGGGENFGPRWSVRLSADDRSNWYGLSRRDGPAENEAQSEMAEVKAYFNNQKNSNAAYSATWADCGPWPLGQDTAAETRQPSADAAHWSSGWRGSGNSTAHWSSGRHWSG